MGKLVTQTRQNQRTFRAAKARLGRSDPRMPPPQAASQAKQKRQIWIASVATRRFGPVWAASSSTGLICVEFGVSRQRFYAHVRRSTGLDPRDGQNQLLEVLRQLREYVDGDRRDFELRVDWSSMTSDFQRRVLRRVMKIPCGQTRTYGQIAREIGMPRASRAVGRANATNPMPLVIPCHRVVGADGELHGYGGAGGLRTKAWLLKMEASRASR